MRAAPRPGIALLFLLALALQGCGGQVQAPTKTAPDPPETGEQTASPSPRFEWLTFHGDPSLTGEVGTSLPETPAPRWRFTTDGEILHTPVSGDGRIFFANAEGRVFAVDSKGQEVWTRSLTMKAEDGKPEKPEALDAPLVYHRGHVIVPAADGMMYALDGTSGDTVWQVDVEAPLLGSPTFDDRYLYVITQSEGILQARDATTGGLVWSGDPVARCDGSLSVGDGFVAFGSCDAAIHLRSVKDGAVLHDIPMDDDAQVAGGVAIVGNEIFSGSRSGMVIQADATSGEVIWKNLDSKDEVFTTPAVSAGWVVIASRDGMVYGLDRATGERKWHFDTGGEPTSPVIAESTVLVASDGTLFLLDRDTGKEKLSIPVSDRITGPAIVGSMIVVGCDDGSVVAFGE